MRLNILLILSFSLFFPVFLFSQQSDFKLNMKLAQRALRKKQLDSALLYACYAYLANPAQDSLIDNFTALVFTEKVKMANHVRARALKKAQSKHEDKAQEMDTLQLATQLANRAFEEKADNHTELATLLATEACKLTNNRNPLFIKIRNKLLKDTLKLFGSNEEKLKYQCVRYAPSGKYFVAAKINEANLWDTLDSKGYCYHGIIEVDDIIFSPDSKYFILYSQSEQSSLYNSNGGFVQNIPYKAEGEMAFSNDGQTLMSGSNRSPKPGAYALRLYSREGNGKWNFEKADTILFYGHSASIRKVAFSPQNNFLLTTCEDTMVRLFDFRGKLIRTFQHNVVIYDAIFSPDEKYILTVDKHAQFCIWNSANGELIQKTHQYGYNIYRSHIGFSKDGRYLIVNGFGGIQLWDFQNLLNGSIPVIQTWRSSEVGKFIDSGDLSPNGLHILLTGGDQLYLTQSTLIKHEREGKHLTIEHKIRYGALKPETCFTFQDPVELVEAAAYFFKEASCKGCIDQRPKLLSAIFFAEKAAQIDPVGYPVRLGNMLRHYLREMDDYLLKNDWQPQREIMIYSDSLSIANSHENFFLQSVHGEIPEDAKLSPTYARGNYAEKLFDLAWTQFFRQEYSNAIYSVQQGLDISPESTWGYTRLALAYLLSDNWAKAEEVFKSWKDKKWKYSGAVNTMMYGRFREAFLYELNFLQSQNIKHPDFDKARRLLGMNPKVYRYPSTIPRHRSIFEFPEKEE